ncbi:MAG: carboxypeptidase-like regulatory domain-containing protein [Niastella sp.]|uniref:carboxypeptidase-like regulatory domain-containing protein n=1 Tax=Niastella sp. TaxID=1869183 RepID=UPI00389B218C
MSRYIQVPGLSLIALLLSMAGLAQNIRGRVTDSTGKAVPFASVNLINSDNNRIIGYAVTDAGGAYTLPVPVNIPVSKLVIQVTSIGYKAVSRPIADVHLAYDFILSVAANQLKSVEIKSSRPVLRTHGDTLSYKVAAFAGAQDLVIGDVIKKLPGITVSSDGTIYYNNKPISNLYIGGDNLLDDKYNIATNTIPQGVVEQVQVIQNDQPVKVLRNKVMSDDVALNLTIKKGAKMQMIGQESVGAGLPRNYDVDLNTMLFKDNYKAINYLKGNNTGSDLTQELVAHNVSNHEQLIDNYMPAALLSLGTVNNPALSRSRYLFNQSGLLNLNNLFKFRHDIQIRVNAWYFHDNQQQEYSQLTTIFLPRDTIGYYETQHNRCRTDLLHTQLTLNCNRDRYYLNDALVMDNNRTAYYSNLNTNNAMVEQVLHDKPLSFSNEFNLIRTLKSNNIIQAYSNVSHSAEPEYRTIGPDYKPAIFNSNNQYGQLIQQVNIPTWFTTNYLSLKIPSNFITQSFKAGFSVQSQKLGSAFNVAQVDNKIDPVSDSSMNNLSWTRTKVYAEADYDLPGTILQANLSLPVNLQQLNYSDSRYTLNKQLTRIYCDPLLRIKYQVSAENYLYLSYNYRNQLGTIEDLYQGYILKDYLTLYANSAELIEKRNQKASAGFCYRKSLIMLFASLNVSYDHLVADKIASAIITNSLQQQVMLPYPNATGSWMVSGTASKYSFTLKTTFSVGLQWQRTRSVQLQNDQLLPFNTITKTGSFGTNIKAGEQVAIDYKATFIQTASHSAVAVSANHINQLQEQVSVEYNPLTNVQFRLSGQHYFTRQAGNSDLKYFFADGSLKFKPNKWKVNFELSAVNILHVKAYRSFDLSANMFTASSYSLPGRIVLLKVMFKI